MRVGAVKYINSGSSFCLGMTSATLGPGSRPKDWMSSEALAIPLRQRGSGGIPQRGLP